MLPGMVTHGWLDGRLHAARDGCMVGVPMACGMGGLHGLFVNHLPVSPWRLGSPISDDYMTLSACHDAHEYGHRRAMHTSHCYHARLLYGASRQTGPGPGAPLLQRGQQAGGEEVVAAQNKPHSPIATPLGDAAKRPKTLRFRLIIRQIRPQSTLFRPYFAAPPCRCFFLVLVSMIMFLK